VQIITIAEAIRFQLFAGVVYARGAAALIQK